MMDLKKLQLSLNKNSIIDHEGLLNIIQTSIIIIKFYQKANAFSKIMLYTKYFFIKC